MRLKTKFLKRFIFSKMKKKNSVFKERNLTKDEAKPLLNRVNKLLDLSEKKTITYEEDTKICPNCSTKNRANANFCRKCGHSLK